MFETVSGWVKSKKARNRKMNAGVLEIFVTLCSAVPRLSTVLCHYELLYKSHSNAKASL